MKKSSPSPLASICVFALFQVICLAVLKVANIFDGSEIWILFPFLSLGVGLLVVVIAAIIFYLLKRK